MPQTYTFSITVEVDDPKALADAALAAALKAPMSPADWESVRHDDSTRLGPVRSDLMMLLDPGSLDDAGCSIISSHVECDDEEGEED